MINESTKPGPNFHRLQAYRDCFSQVMEQSTTFSGLLKLIKVRQSPTYLLTCNNKTLCQTLKKTRRSTRSEDRRRRNICRTSTHVSLYLVRSRRVWNTLPREMRRNSIPLATFKTLLKRYLETSWGVLILRMWRHRRRSASNVCPELHECSFALLLMLNMFVFNNVSRMLSVVNLFVHTRIVFCFCIQIMCQSMALLKVVVLFTADVCWLYRVQVSIVDCTVQRTPERTFYYYDSYICHVILVPR